MTELSLATVFGIVLILGGLGFAVLAGRLRFMSTGRNDAPKGNATVIGGYWTLSGVLLLAGVILLAVA